MKNKFWISTSIALLLVNSIATPIVLADTIDSTEQSASQSGSASSVATTDKSDTKPQSQELSETTKSSVPQSSNTSQSSTTHPESSSTVASSSGSSIEEETSTSSENTSRSTTTAKNTNSYVVDGENGIISHKFTVTSPDGKTTYQPGDKIPNDGDQLIKIELTIDMSKMESNILIPVQLSAENSNKTPVISDGIVSLQDSKIDYNGETILSIGSFYEFSRKGYDIGIRKFNGKEYTSDYNGIISISFVANYGKVYDKDKSTYHQYYTNFHEDAEKIYYDEIIKQKELTSTFSISINNVMYPNFATEVLKEESEKDSSWRDKKLTKSSSYSFGSGGVGFSGLNDHRFFPSHPENIQASEETTRTLNRAALDSMGNYEGTRVIGNTNDYPIVEKTTSPSTDEILGEFLGINKIDAVYLTTIKATEGSEITRVEYLDGEKLIPQESTLSLSEIYKKTLTDGVGTKLLYKLADGTYVIAKNYGTAKLSYGMLKWNSVPSGALDITFSDIAKKESALATTYSNYTGTYGINQIASTKYDFKIIEGIEQVRQATISDEISNYKIEGQTSVKIHYVDINGKLIDLVDTKSGFPTNKISSIDNQKHSEQALVSPKLIKGYKAITSLSDLSSEEQIKYKQTITSLKQNSTDAQALLGEEKINFPGEEGVIYDSDGRILSKTGGAGTGITDVYFVYLEDSEPSITTSTKTIKKTVHYQTADGKKLADDYTTSVSFIETQTKDSITGEVTTTYDKDSDNLSYQSNPKIKGYQVVTNPDGAESNQTVKFGDKDIELTVVYEKDTVKNSTKSGTPSNHTSNKLTSLSNKTSIEKTNTSYLPKTGDSRTIIAAIVGFVVLLVGFIMLKFKSKDN